jgi:hypothetical protein
MNAMKLIYYGFGGFIGFVCGVVINLIFYWLEKSGVHFARDLVENYGLFGRYLIELIKALPYIGIAMGIILVKLLFGKQLEGENNG